MIEATYNLELIKERVKVYLTAYDTRGYQAQFKLTIVYDESDAIPDYVSSQNQIQWNEKDSDDKNTEENVESEV